MLPAGRQALRQRLDVGLGQRGRRTLWADQHAMNQKAKSGEAGDLLLLFGGGGERRVLSVVPTFCVPPIWLRLTGIRIK